jgi:hypothetical protein
MSLWLTHHRSLKPLNAFAKKGGREIIARAPGEQEAEEASEWLLDRLKRLAPELDLSTEIKSGGGQYVLALRIS